MSPKRLFYEFEGMKSFAKYTPQLVPKVYLYDPDEDFIAYEYLGGYTSIQKLFISGDMDIDFTRFLGIIVNNKFLKSYYYHYFHRNSYGS